MNEITVKDIQPKKTIGELCANRVRKAWVLQMTEEQKQKFSHFPGKVKQQLYKSFDSEVQQIWIDLMKSKNEQLIKDGAKMIKGKVTENEITQSRFSDEHAIDVNELLIEAAKIWLSQFDKRSAND